MNGATGFRGELRAKVIRARPSLWQRVTDFLRGLT